MSVEDYRMLSDHTHGPHVVELTSKNSAGDVVAKVSWKGVLDYDHEVRKKSYEMVRSGSMATISLVLAAACKDSEVKQLHMLDPMTLASMSNTHGAKPGLRRPQEDGWEAPPIKFIKGKGKGRGKGKGKKGDSKVNGLFVKIPNNGKLICFA